MLTNRNFNHVLLLEFMLKCIVNQKYFKNIHRNEEIIRGKVNYGSP